jgi:ketosteroid isomerase-like protein
MKKIFFLITLISFISCEQTISKSENEILIEMNNTTVSKNFEAYNSGDFEVFESTISDDFTFTLRGELDISGTYTYQELLKAAGAFQSLLKNGWKGNVDKIISGVNGSVIVLSGKAEGVNGEYNNDYIWLYSINKEGKVSSITEYLSDLLFVKQLYGQEICGEKKTMEQL